MQEEVHGVTREAHPGPQGHRGYKGIPERQRDDGTGVGSGRSTDDGADNITRPRKGPVLLLVLQTEEGLA